MKKMKANTIIFVKFFWAKNAAMALKWDVLVKSGLFDPDFFLEYEEIDLCWRIRLMGYKVVFVPTSVVYHKGGGSRRGRSKELIFHDRKNHISSLIKNYSSVNIVKFCSVYLLLLFAHVFILFSKSKYSQGIGRMRAVLWCLKNLPSIWSKHLQVNYNVRRISDERLISSKIMLKSDFAEFKQLAA